MMTWHNLVVSVFLLFSLSAPSAQQTDLAGPGSAQTAPTSAQTGAQEEIANPPDVSEPSPARPSETGDIVPGRLTSGVDIKYPKDARKKKIQGTVVLQATIEKNGNVNGLSIVSGDVTLAEAAVDAVRDWRFEPYTQNGQPVKVQQNLTFNFVQGKKMAELDPQFPPPSLATPPLISKPIVSTQNRVSPEGSVFRVGGESLLRK